MTFAAQQAQSSIFNLNIAPKQLWGTCSDGPVDKVFVNAATNSPIGLDGIYIVDQHSFDQLRANYNGSSVTPPDNILRYNGQKTTFDDIGHALLACEKVNGVRVNNCTIGTGRGAISLSPKGVACLVVSNVASSVPVPANVSVAFGEAATSVTTGDAARGNRYDGTLLLAVLIAAIVLGPLSQFM
ncbi:hypothetical protein BDF19DRAFT_423687 [Syncephalis fuscata]|nr:hypothetical protein BDF19DRAFT_423687 [Syncephalis fuscata]